ncbi:MAG: M20 family metallopeptidase, partial [Candidatus Binatia bacterium]
MIALRLSLLAALLAATPSLAGPPDYEPAAASVRRLMEELVTADTTNPPGNEARAVAIVERRLKEAGIAFESSEFAPGRENLVARLGGSGEEEPLLLLAHTDVVGTAGQNWSSDPLRVTEKEGFLLGRGVSDDLGMAAVATEVMILLERSGTPLRRDVILALTGDEESGGAGIRHLLAERPAG